jgi:hypothetical protein
VTGVEGATADCGCPDEPTPTVELPKMTRTTACPFGGDQRSHPTAECRKPKTCPMLMSTGASKAWLLLTGIAPAGSIRLHRVIISSCRCNMPQHTGRFLVPASDASITTEGGRRKARKARTCSKMQRRRICQPATATPLLADTRGVRIAPNRQRQSIRRFSQNENLCYFAIL